MWKWAKENYPNSKIAIEDRRLVIDGKVISEPFSIPEESTEGKEAKAAYLLNSDLQYLKGVGPKRYAHLKRMGLFKVKDLIQHFPKRYEDRTNLTPIAEAKIGEYATIKGEIKARSEGYPRRRTKLTKVIVDDGTDRITAVWFNQPYLKELLPVGQEVIFFGKVDKFTEKQMVHPEFEVLDKDKAYTGKIVPVYSQTQEVNRRFLRKLIAASLQNLKGCLTEYLPEEIIAKHQFIDYPQAIENIHFPTSMEDKEKARNRFIYEEFFLLQLGLGLLRKRIGGEKQGIQYRGGKDLVTRLEELLPFSLTSKQKEVLEQIRKDMTSSDRMMRLLHGDVGSGKTVIALGAFLLAQDNGYQSAIMVPTAILAEQHYLTLQKFTAPLGTKVGLLISQQSKKEREDTLQRLQEGDLDILIGTHALLQENIKFNRLGLVVVDEQHKFGVLQRDYFKKLAPNPDILVMSATPIPRSLALALYGDMDISTLDELPPGRATTSTFWVPEKEKKRVYEFVQGELDKGGQAFIVSPLIEESDKLSVASAEETFAYLKREVFTTYKIALLHGKVPAKEQEKIMQNFRQKKIDLLVATSLVEEGLDIPEATVMVVLNAERFGLSQLHQFRGRIGRGERPSYCILVASPTTEKGTKRLEAMVSSADGFQIAQEDLEIRGPGELLGLKQHGFPEIKLGNILTDLNLLEKAREDAHLLLQEDSQITKHPELKDVLQERFPQANLVMGKL